MKLKIKDLTAKECHVRFGKFIKDARTDKGLYQEELADMVGISQSYMSYLENGNRDIDLALAFKLLDALNLDIQDFMKQFM